MSNEMKSVARCLCLVALALVLSQCRNDATQRAPWEHSDDATVTDGDDNHFSFSEIVENGELIVLTLSGPDTYFDYHGKGMGTQYLLCSDFAGKTGLQLRVELCGDTTELLERLHSGEGDVVMMQMSDSCGAVIACGYSERKGVAWLVSKQNGELADTLNKWFDPKILAEVKKEETRRFSTQNVRRVTASPMLNASAGIISEYDALFQRYAPVAHWDWRLVAAQCYQESAFDAQAVSWAGACGLMQIMPYTAEVMGLSMEQIYDPEANIRTAARYIARLEAQFTDVSDAAERRCFVLAAYNGGAQHIRDAMALTEKYGGNKYRWHDVRTYVRGLSETRYYTDAVVKNGYMRGEETADYVDSVLSRWDYYRGKARGSSVGGGSQDYYVPQKATKEHRFKL